MSVQIVTFEDVTSQEDFEIACECRWHRDSGSPAEWIVHHDGFPCGCRKPGTVLWCDGCLKAVVEHKGNIRCRSCGEQFLNDTSKFVVEPLWREAA